MKKATSILVPLLALALTCLYPCAFQYFRNADEAAPGDMVPLLLIFLAMGAAVLLHEFLSGRELFGCGIMLCAVILVQLPEGFWKRKIKANNE